MAITWTRERSGTAKNPWFNYFGHWGRYRVFISGHNRGSKKPQYAVNVGYYRGERQLLSHRTVTTTNTLKEAKEWAVKEIRKIRKLQRLEKQERD